MFSSISLFSKIIFLSLIPSFFVQTINESRESSYILSDNLIIGIPGPFLFKKQK